jgi:hypothetical protein
LTRSVVAPARSFRAHSVAVWDFVNRVTRCPAACYVNRTHAPPKTDPAGPYQTIAGVKEAGQQGVNGRTSGDNVEPPDRITRTRGDDRCTGYERPPTGGARTAKTEWRDRIGRKEVRLPSGRGDSAGPYEGSEQDWRHNGWSRTVRISQGSRKEVVPVAGEIIRSPAMGQVTETQ